MLKKFVLIDAYSIIFRSFYAFIKNPLRNSKGQNTSGIFGFLNTLEKIKKNLTTEYMCLAFDAPGETFRDKEFKEYKANRPPAPPDIPFQIEKVKELTQYLGIKDYEVEGYEADDILATCTTQLKNCGEIYIVSSDKDLMQLVSDNVYVYDAFRNIIYDRNKVIEKFGIPPEKITDYLALAGDASDNIPGVPGVGPKRAVEIIKKYTNFEKAIGKDNRLTAHKNEALLSKKLVTLEYEVPLNVNPDVLRTKNPDFKKLMPILQDLEFHSYITIFSTTDDSEFKIMNIKKLPEIKIDKIIGISLDDENQIYLCTTSDMVARINQDHAKHVLDDKNITKIGYNIKDLIKKVNITSPIFDVGIVAWLLDPNRRLYKLDNIVLQHLQVNTKTTPVNTAHLVFQLYPILSKGLKKSKQDTLYHRIEEPLISVLAKMEKRGIKIDLSYFKQLGAEIHKEIAQNEKSIFKHAGKVFNINSPKQLAHILFDELKLKPSKKGKTHYSTNVEVLQQLSATHPLPGEILAYRELSKIKSTYIEPFIALAQIHRIHTTFHQTGTTTGRLSSSNPNIQNIPIRTSLGRKIRKGFIAEKGFVLISADYSQVELRILAHITNDKNLINAFKQNTDIHCHTASLVFNIPPEKVDDEKRRMAKVVNYGLIYGMSDYGLAQGLDIPHEQALQFIDSYYTLYPEVDKWRERAITKAEDKGYTETLFGRRRPLSDIHSSNRNLREFSKRAAINTPIQGTAADVIKLAMIEVEERLTQAKFKSGLLLSIHDELLFEIEEARIEEAKTIIKESMENIIDLIVPIKISMGVGKNWNVIH
jgi:DNA polymerase-1